MIKLLDTYTVIFGEDKIDFNTKIIVTASDFQDASKKAHELHPEYKDWWCCIFRNWESEKD